MNKQQYIELLIELFHENLKAGWYEEAWKIRREIEEVTEEE
jgi:hypothetical protein